MTTPTPLTVSPALPSVALLVADRPRAIDAVIDYFGEPPRVGAGRGLRAAAER